jgi:hypothetical protein
MTVVIIVTSPRPYRPLHLWSTFRGARQRTGNRPLPRAGSSSH